MSEISTNFTKKKNFYLKDDVDQYVKKVDAKFQEKDAKVDSLTKQVSELESRLQSMTGGDTTVEEKVELYDKLMKKMGDDYQNLLAPAIAKAKIIQEEAEKEYALRIDQAKYSADGIYDRTAGKIAETVDANMDRLYDLLDEFLYSKTLPGRVESLIKGCRVLSKKMAQGIHSAAKGPAQFFENVSGAVKKQTSRIVEVIASRRASKQGVPEDTLVEEDVVDAEPVVETENENVVEDVAVNVSDDAE